MYSNVNFYTTDVFYDLKLNERNMGALNAEVYNCVLCIPLSSTSLQFPYYGSYGRNTHITGVYGVKLSGGGSSVTPNPIDPATDTLTSIEIDGTVYSVGGGDASAEEITLSDYNALTTEEKNDGTIRFIPKSNIGYGLDIDFTDSIAYKESGMSGTTVNNNSVQIVWDITNTYCGLTIYPTVKVDVTNYDYISYDFTSTNSYDSLHPGYENPLRDLGIGLKATAPSTMTLAPNMDYTVWNRYGVTDVGTTFTDERIDVSNLTGEYYLIIACAGWNATVSNIVIGTEGGNPSQIKYMDKTYGISSGGGGSGDSFITYTKTITTTNYGWWTVEDKDGNVLDPDEYIIVDISVTPYYYDVLWSTDSDGGNHYFATLININDVYEVRSSTTYEHMLKKIFLVAEAEDLQK